MSTIIDPATAPREARLNAWLEGLIITACVAIPARFNPFSAAGAEGSKVFLWWGFGTVLAMGSALKWMLARPAPTRPAPLPAVVGLPLLAFGAITAISTLSALSPRLGLFGAYGRAGGLLTLLAGMAFLTATAGIARQPAAFSRIVTALCLGSLAPVAVALTEGAGFGPLYAPPGAFEGRVSATFGNPLFLADYLVAILPLTLWLAWHHRHRRGDANRTAAASGIWWAALALGQGMALWLTRGRGPLTAGAASLGIGAVTAAALSGRRRPARAFVLTGLLVMTAALMLLHRQQIVPFTKTDGVENTPLSLRAGSLRVRLHLLDAASTRLFSGATPVVPDDAASAETFTPWRTALGYGPQNQHLATQAYFSPALERLELPGSIIDSAHNRLQDIALESGLLGLVAALWLSWGLIVTLMRPLLRRCDGTNASAAKRRGLGLSLALSALTGTALLGVLWGRFAWPLGIVFGATLGALAFLWRLRPAPAPVRPSDILRADAAAGAGLLPLGMSLMAYGFAAQASPRSLSAGLVFWTVAGLAIGRANPEPTAVTAKTPTNIEPALIRALTLTAAAMLAAGVTLALPLPDLRGALATSWQTGLLPATLLTVTAGLMLAGLTNAPSNTHRRYARVCYRRGWHTLCLTALVATTLWIHHALLSHWMSAPLHDPAPVLLLIRRLGWLGQGWSALVLVMAAWVGLKLRQRQPGGMTPGERAGAAVAFALSAALFIWPTIQTQSSDIASSVAQALAHKGRFDLALHALKPTTQRGPWRQIYHIQAHRLWREWALVAPPAERDALLATARQALEMALLAEPLDARRYEDIGNLYAVWTRQTTNRKAQTVRARLTAQAYAKALTLAPGWNRVRLKQAQVLTSWTPDKEAAAQVWTEMLRRDPAHPVAAEHLAYHHADQARQTVSPEALRAKLLWVYELTQIALHSPDGMRYNVDVQRLRQLETALSRTLEQLQ